MEYLLLLRLGSIFAQIFKNLNNFSHAQGEIIEIHVASIGGMVLRLSSRTEVSIVSNPKLERRKTNKCVSTPYPFFIMLSLEACKKILNLNKNKTFSDEEVKILRETLYRFAEYQLEAEGIINY